MPTRQQLEAAAEARQAFGQLQGNFWGGRFVLNGITLIFERKGGFTFVIALYSSIDAQGLWWYGLQERHWSKWTEGSYLAFLMKDADGVSVVVLDPIESTRLLDMTEPSADRNKKIHIRRPANGGKIYVVEWPDFRLADRLQRLPM
jgi:hypothetical protein